MQITNKSIFLGDTSKEARSGAVRSDTKQSGRKSIFAGDLRQTTDPIAQKRQEAQKKAMKVVSDVFKNERKIDEDLEKRREHIEELRGQIKAASEQYAEIEARKEELKEIYGITKENPVSEEYKERVEELNKGLQALNEEIGAAEKSIKEEAAIIRGVKMERLKTHPMLDAMNQKDAILDAAGNEIMGMLVEEGKEHLDEKTEEKKEQAEKLQEEKEKKEEQIEAVKEKVEEMEAFVEETKASNKVKQKQSEQLDDSVYQMLELEEIKIDVQKEVESIVDKMALVIEDIKGACVDRKL